MRKINFQNENYYHLYNRGADKRDIFLDERDYARFLKNLKEMNNALSDSQRDYLKRSECAAPNFDTGCAEKNKNLSPAQRSDLEYPRSDLNFNPRSDLNFNPRSDLNFNFNFDPLISIISYCLNKNHYHLLVKQLVEKGIVKFMKKIGTAYSMYFNKKYSRSGALFEGRFKAAEIKSDYRLIALSAYINGNPEVHGIMKAKNWPWPSYRDYIGTREGTIGDQKEIKEIAEILNLKNYQKFSEETINNFRFERLEKIKALKNYVLE